ncbi:MAG: ABC transporter permease [Chloroherpetonaceae bacterium]|nr:ABC transporter permease [Chloroherpetonaceae bacterium]
MLQSALRYTEKINDRFKSFFEMMQDFFGFSLHAFRMLGSTKRYWKDTMNQAFISGTESLPIVFVSSVSIGSLLVMEVGNILTDFGAKGLTGRTTAFSVIRELGPMVTGLMLSARVGARNGSELGAMKISEQIDALRAFGTDPIAKLVVPRLVASLIMFLPLTAFSIAIGLIGGSYIAENYLHLDPGIYWNSSIRYLNYRDFITFSIKPPVFAVMITLVSCYNGFSAKGGTVGVGESTIKGIVVSSGLVMVLNFYLSKIVHDFIDKN